MLSPEERINPSRARFDLTEHFKHKRRAMRARSGSIAVPQIIFITLSELIQRALKTPHYHDG
jgi:hypothetical protein